MKSRFSLIALVSVVSTLSLPALATSGVTPTAGEIGFTTHAVPAAKTRAEVMQELQAWKRNPVSADGWRYVGGEIGAVYVGVPSGTAMAAKADRKPMQAGARGSAGLLSHSGHQAGTFGAAYGQP